MKKLVSILLALALLLSLAGCRQEEEEEEIKPLHIVVDVIITQPDELDNGLSNYEESIRQTMTSFKQEVRSKLGISDLEIEILPAFNTQERQDRIREIHQEMLDGEGPDVFILRNTNRLWGDDPTESSLFTEPEAFKDSGLLLCLDDYIAEAEYMEWDQLTQSVMAAGYSEVCGQVILPVSYSVPVTYYRKSTVTHWPSAAMTFDDMLAGDEVLRAAAAGVSWSSGMGETLFGQLADFNTGELTFTEEEFVSAVKDYYDFYWETDAHASGALPARMEGYDLCYQFELYSWNYQRAVEEYDGVIEGDVSGRYIPDLHEALENTMAELNYTDEEITIIPVYNKDGGVTAVVNGYACINSGTRRAKDAFLLLDYMLSGYGQAYLGIDQSLIGTGMPTYEFDGTDEELPKQTWNNTPENFAAIAGVRDAITQAHFAGGVSYEFTVAYNEYNRTQSEETLREAYNKMKERAAQ